MGDFHAQLFPTINIFIELEEVMVTIMAMSKNDKKRKPNGIITIIEYTI